MDLACVFARAASCADDGRQAEHHAELEGAVRGLGRHLEPLRRLQHAVGLTLRRRGGEGRRRRPLTPQRKPLPRGQRQRDHRDVRALSCCWQYEPNARIVESATTPLELQPASPNVFTQLRYNDLYNPSNVTLAKNTLKPYRWASCTRRAALAARGGLLAAAVRRRRQPRGRRACFGTRAAAPVRAG